MNNKVVKSNEANSPVPHAVGMPRFTKFAIALGVCAVVPLVMALTGTGSSSMWGSAADVPPPPRTVGLESIAGNVTSSAMLLPLPAAGERMDVLAPTAAARFAENEVQASSARHVAVQRSVQYRVDKKAVTTLYEEVMGMCSRGTCEVVSGEVSETKIGRLSFKQADVVVRGDPKDVDGIITLLGTKGVLEESKVQSEDKTAAVVDAEARIKNMTALRDSLQKMVAAGAVNMADLLAASRGLAEVQAEIDAAQSLRKILETQTTKVELRVSLTQDPEGADIRTATDGEALSKALRDAAGNFMAGLAMIITFLSYTGPVLLLVGFVFLAPVVHERLRKSPTDDKAKDEQIGSKPSNDEPDEAGQR